MLLYRSALGEELLEVLKMFEWSFKFKEILAKEKRDGYCHDLADSRWEILYKAF
jgi:hypothetical protein